MAVSTVIKRNRPGAMWLRALFRHHCREHNCKPNWLNSEMVFASKPEVHDKFARSIESLNLKIVDALAVHDHQSRNAVIFQTTEDHVRSECGF